MDVFPGKDIPPGSRRHDTNSDLKSLGNVEKHLRAQLEVERRNEANSTHGPVPETLGIERRVNRKMMMWDCFPDGKLALKGRLSALAVTLDKGTYRAYLRNNGDITTVLYINFELGTCLVTALVPHLPLLVD